MSQTVGYLFSLGCAAPRIIGRGRTFVQFKSQQRLKLKPKAHKRFIVEVSDTTMLSKEQMLVTKKRTINIARHFKLKEIGDHRIRHQ